MTNLAGRRILVVEDEILIALLIESLLKEMGCVVSKASGLDEALALIDDEPRGFDAATLNLGLNGEKADELAALPHATGHRHDDQERHGQHGTAHAEQAVAPPG